MAQRGDGRVDRVELGHEKWMNDQKEERRKDRETRRKTQLITSEDV